MSLCWEDPVLSRKRTRSKLIISGSSSSRSVILRYVQFKLFPIVPIISSFVAVSLAICLFPPNFLAKFLFSSKRVALVLAIAESDLSFSAISFLYFLFFSARSWFCAAVPFLGCFWSSLTSSSSVFIFSRRAASPTFWVLKRCFLKKKLVFISGLILPV